MKIPEEDLSQRLAAFMEDLEKLLNEHHLTIIPTVDTEEVVGLFVAPFEEPVRMRVMEDFTGDPMSILIEEECIVCNGTGKVEE